MNLAWLTVELLAHLALWFGAPAAGTVYACRRWVA